MSDLEQGRNEGVRTERADDPRYGRESVSDASPVPGTDVPEELLTRGAGHAHGDPGLPDQLPAPTSLFPAGEADGFRSRWMDIQTHFVDEPRQSVEEADGLVREVADHLVSVFTRNRDELERQWVEGDEVSTEDLRRTLMRYRGFFERLLAV